MEKEAKTYLDMISDKEIEIYLEKRKQPESTDARTDKLIIEITTWRKKVETYLKERDLESFNIIVKILNIFRQDINEGIIKKLNETKVFKNDPIKELLKVEEKVHTRKEEV